MMITCIDYYGREIKSKVRPILKDGHIVHRIELPPGYKPVNPVTTLPDVEPDEIVWCWIDPKTAYVKGVGMETLEQACRANLRAARTATPIIPNRRLWDNTPQKPIKIAQDRGYYTVYDAEVLLAFLSRTGTFEKADGSLHHPHEPGWEYVGSWKTTRRPPPVLQVTLWREPELGWPPEGNQVPGGYVAELDLDLEAGIKHVAEAIRNEITGAKTHPYVVVQQLARFWGICPFYLEPGE